ncbi:hypothetical protein L0128_08355, partial [candidate division KSB1 bacterium]|nr:hypothetical protein [candidate division KSB1 bacterium]
MLKRLGLRWLLWTIGSLTLLSRLAYPAAGNKVLVLYKERDPDHQGIVWFLTGFLKQAGYDFDTRDVEQLLVAKSDMSPYRGIMTCYQTSQMVGGEIYPHWLVQQMEAGRRILIIGSYGAYQGLIPKPDGTFVEWNESTLTMNTFFYPFGLEFYFAFTSDPKKLRLNYADPEYAQYQAPITPKDLTYFQLYKSINPANRVLMEIERTDMADARSALNVMTPFGAMIIEGYAWYWNPQLQTNILRVNFVKLMREVFAGISPTVPQTRLISHAELLQKYPLPQRPQPSSSWQMQPGELPRQILIPYKKSEASRLP